MKLSVHCTLNVKHCFTCQAITLVLVVQSSKFNFCLTQENDLHLFSAKIKCSQKAECAEIAKKLRHKNKTVYSIFYIFSKIIQIISTYTCPGAFTRRNIASSFCRLVILIVVINFFFTIVVVKKLVVKSLSISQKTCKIKRELISLVKTMK